MDDHEGVGVGFVDNFPEFWGLGEGDDDIEHFFGLSGIGAYGVEDGNTSGHGGEDACGDCFVFFGDDPDRFFAIESGYDFVGDLGGDEDAKQGIHGDFNIEKKCGDGHDDDIKKEAEEAHIDAVVFPENCGEDIGAASGAVDSKDHAAGKTEEYAPVDGCKHWIVDEIPIPRKTGGINQKRG